MFQRELSEYNRKIAKGYSAFYCSTLCYHNNKDDFAPFRQIFYQSRQTAKNKNIEFNLTLEYLRDLWTKQQGVCSYSNIKMILPEKLRQTISSPKQASLDRIDSSKGYIKGNVEFVILFVNLGKNKFSSEQVKHLISEFRASLS